MLFSRENTDILQESMGLFVLFSKGISSSSQEVFTTRPDSVICSASNSSAKIIFDIYWSVRHSSLRGQSLSWLQERSFLTRWIHNNKEGDSGIERTELYTLRLHFQKLHKFEYPSLSLLTQDKYRIESVSLQKILPVRSHTQILSLHTLVDNKLLILQ